MARDERARDRRVEKCEYPCHRDGKYRHPDHEFDESKSSFRDEMTSKDHGGVKLVVIWSEENISHTSGFPSCFRISDFHDDARGKILSIARGKYSSTKRRSDMIEKLMIRSECHS